MMYKDLIYTIEEQLLVFIKYIIGNITKTTYGWGCELVAWCLLL